VIGVLQRVVIASRLGLDSKFKLRRKSLQLVCGFKYCNLPTIHHDYHSKLLLQASNIYVVQPGSKH
jgi:hypothetical protein